MSTEGQRSKLEDRSSKLEGRYGIRKLSPVLWIWMNHGNGKQILKLQQAANVGHGLPLFPQRTCIDLQGCHVELLVSKVVEGNKTGSQGNRIRTSDTLEAPQIREDEPTPFRFGT
jgi:hypothetical protein